MIRNLLKSAFILALLTLFFWLTDEKSQLNFTFNGTVYALSIPEAAIGLFVFFLLAELLFLSFRATVTLLKNDVLLSNHSFQNDKESIENTQTGNEDKIVLSRNQFDEAAILIVRTMGAVTAGLMNEARRLLVSLRKIVGDDAIIDILMLKIYKGEKNFDKMEQLSQKLMQNEDIQLVGMKAALEAQMQKKEFTEALKTVNQAFEVRQDLYWVISSAFLLRAKSNDWLGALEVLEAGIDKNITPEQKAARLKAVALYG